MRQLIFLILLCGLISGCCKNKPQDIHDDLYTIIDEMIRFRYPDAEMVISDPILVRKRIDSTLPPPPPGYVHYSKNLFYELYNSQLIDSADINFMFHQIDSIQEFVLDSSKIDRPVVSWNQFKTLLKSHRDTSEQSITSLSYIRISTPITSKIGDKILLDIVFFCGTLCGSGATYLLEKKDGKWRIVYSSTNWIS